MSQPHQTGHDDAAKPQTLRIHPRIWTQLFSMLIFVTAVGYCLGLAAAVLAGWNPSSFEIMMWGFGGVLTIVVISILAIVLIGGLASLWKSRSEEDL